MASENRQRGRPRKKEGAISPTHFMRAGMVMSAYDEARQGGHKHSVAVRLAVDFVRQRDPKIPISETVVKRILAERRPRNRPMMLSFEGSPATQEEVDKIRMMHELLKLTGLLTDNGLVMPTPPIGNPPGNVMRFAARIAERQEYPRHNRKPPKQ